MPIALAEGAQDDTAELNGSRGAPGPQSSPSVRVPEVDALDTDESDFISTRSTSLVDTEASEPQLHRGSFSDAASILLPLNPSAESVYPGSHSLEGDTDSDLGSTRSIMASLDIEYVMENGRRYCGQYYLPNDDEEQLRWLLMDRVYRQAFDGELTSVPLDNPRLILDVGAGTGEWACDMAEKYPDCEVIGSDIGNVFTGYPSRQIPPNVIWEIDDAEQEWIRPYDHDLVHFRHMSGAFRDWSFVYGQAFQALKPGGYIEVLDFDDLRSSNNAPQFLSAQSAGPRVILDSYEAAILSGRPRGIGHLEPRLLFDAGFEDVRLVEHAIPISPRESSTGHLFLKAITTGVETAVLRLLTKYKGWTPQEVREASSSLVAEIEGIALDRRRRKDFKLKIIIMTGRKPDDAGSAYSVAPSLEIDSRYSQSLAGTDDGYGSGPPVESVSDEAQRLAVDVDRVGNGGSESISHAAADAPEPPSRH